MVFQNTQQEVELMHLVISGYYGFNNIGDEAILYSIILGLRKVNPNINITVLSNNPKTTEQKYNVHAVNRKNIMAINQVIKQSDGLISGGGSLFQDSTSIKTVPYYAGIIKIATIHQKPIFIYAQGVGPLNRRISKWIVKRIFNQANQITVRDMDSKTLLSEIGVNHEPIIVPDPVLGLNGEKTKTRYSLHFRHSQPVISVSVRDWPTKKPYKERIAHALDQLADNGYSIRFVPMHGEHDKQTSKEIDALMQHQSQIIDCNASIEEKIAAIGHSKLLIGIRLHALIFSAISHVPFIALSYDPKIDAFAQICQQPIIGHIENDDWDGDKLFDVAKQVLLNEVNNKHSLQSHVKQLQDEAHRTPVMAINMFIKHAKGGHDE